MRVIFNSHSVTTLKKEVSKTNIKGYSKMKKAEVVNLMVKNQSRFAHIKMNEKKSAPKKTEPRKKIVMTSFPKPKGKPKGKQRVPNEEPAPATLQQAVGSRPKPKKKKKLVIIKKPEPPKPKPQKKDKKTLLLEKETPKLYKKLETEFFNNKKTMGRKKALTLFKQKINKAYEDLLERKETEANIKKQELPQLMAIAGLTKAEANKLDPAELFGLLPKELVTNIVLNPKATGVKVAKHSKVITQAPQNVYMWYDDRTEEQVKNDTLTGTLKSVSALGDLEIRSSDLIKKEAKRLFGYLTKLNENIESDNPDIKSKRKMLINARKKYLDNFEKRKLPLLKYDKEIRGRKVVYVYKGKIKILPKHKEFVLSNAESRQLSEKSEPRRVYVDRFAGMIGSLILFRTKEEANEYYWLVGN